MLKTARTAAVAAALIAGLPLSAEAACVGPECPPSKPLDIQKIMREQAASTRTAEPKPVSRAKHRAHPAVQASKPDKPKADAPKTDTTKAQRTAKRKTTPPEDTVSSAAPGKAPAAPPPSVQVVAAEEFNAIDRAAPPAPAFAPAETVGAAPAQQDVKTVVSAAFNEIDRKAQENKEIQPSKSTALAMAETAPQAQDPPAKAETGRSTSVMGWLWSSVTGTFAALTTAVRQLTGGVVP